MAISISDIKETIEINEEDLLKSSQLVNELIVSDLMVSLGYNKKKDKAVRRLYDATIDWIVLDNNIKLALKAFAMGDADEQTANAIIEAKNYCSQKRISILLLTNAKTLTIMRFNKVTQEYARVTAISLIDEFSDADEKLIAAISKQTFDLTVIDNALKLSAITTEKVIDVLKSEAEAIKPIVASKLNVEVSAIDKLYIDSLDSLSEGSAIHDSEPTSSDTATAIELDQAKAKIESLTTELNELRQSVSQSTDDYVIQIRELTEKNEKLLIRAEDLQAELNTLNSQNFKSLESVKEEANELLNTIAEDIPDEDTYAAVINSKLIQSVELPVFLGKVIQELYEIKSFEAAKYIFDADMYKLVSPAKVNHIIMNGKAYDIDLTNITEDVAITRLQMLMSNFKDIVFVYRKLEAEKSDETTTVKVTLDKSVVEETIADDEDTAIDFGEPSDDDILDFGESEGTESDDIIDDSDSEIDFGEPSDFDIESDSDIEGFGDEVEGFDSIEGFGDESDGFSDEADGFGGETDGLGDESEGFEDDAFGSEAEGFGDNVEGFGDDSFGDEAEGFGDIEGFDDEPTESSALQKYLLVQNFENVDALVWSDENISFETVKYIGTQDVTYVIDGGDSDYTYNELLVKCFDAVIAIETGSGNADIIQTIKSKDFSTVNNFIKLFTTEYKDYPRINGTRYVVAGVESVQQVATILIDLCNSINITLDNKYIYFDASTDSQIIIDNYSYDEDAIQLKDDEMYTAEGSSNYSVGIIKGDMFNNILITKQSLAIHKDIVYSVDVVRNKYFESKLDTMYDVQQTIFKIIESAFNSGARIDYNAIGNILGDAQYKIISDNEQDVTPEHLSYQIGNKLVFCSTFESWQIIHAIIKTHISVYNNTAIAIKSQINTDALRYYANEYGTTDPSLALAINSYVNYILSSLRNK